MLRRFLLPVFVLCVLLLISCTKTEPEANSNATANANRAATTSSPAKTTASTSGGEKIGVAECDDFLAKYESCVKDKVPETAREQFNTSMKTWRDSWHKLAANPQTKGTLAAACKQAADQAKTSMKAYNCTF